MRNQDVGILGDHIPITPYRLSRSTLKAQLLKAGWTGDPQILNPSNSTPEFSR